MAPALRQFQSLRDLGLSVEVIDMNGRSKLKYLSSVRPVRAAAQRADLIHAHFGYCGWLAQVQKQKPIVLSFMGSDVYGDILASGSPGIFSRTVAAVNRRFLSQRVNAIIVKSQAMADMLSPTPCHVIPNGVDTDLFIPQSREQARQQLGWSLDRHYLLFPGDAGNPRKGFALAGEVVAAVQDRLPGLELVKLWGVPPEKVPVYMNASDAMLMASFAEGSPNVVKEAMACNLPIVASPVGDVGELLEDVAGNRVMPRNAKHMSDALVELILASEPSMGRARIEQLGLGLKETACRIRQIYESVLQQN